MMRRSLLVLVVLGLGAILLTRFTTPSPLTAAQADDKPAAAASEEPAVRKVAEEFVGAFNKGDPQAVAAMFHAEGILTDENGNVYRGRTAIAELFQGFFKRFPNPKVSGQVESVTFPTPDVAVVNGVTQVEAKETPVRARNRFVSVVARKDGKWLMTTFREFADDEEPTPGERLQQLAWLVGDWVDEGQDRAIALNVSWSEDKNYLIARYTVQTDGKKVLGSTQRVGWDPLQQKIRSWIFDSDGGFGEGYWTRAGERWLVKATNVLPDGTTGSSTFVYTPAGKDKFTWQSVDRIVGDQLESDLAVTIVRKAPAAGN
jgi:uncharacterized protein (TIGR02246 family)